MLLLHTKFLVPKSKTGSNKTFGLISEKFPAVADTTTEIYCDPQLAQIFSILNVSTTPIFQSNITN